MINAHTLCRLLMEHTAEQVAPMARRAETLANGHGTDRANKIQALCLAAYRGMHEARLTSRVDKYHWPCRSRSRLMPGGLQLLRSDTV